MVQILKFAVIVLFSVSLSAQILQHQNGGTDIGAVGTDALYRIIKVGNGYIVNGWDGHIYHTTTASDGQVWTATGLVVASPLYAPGYLGNNVVLQGADNGHIYYSRSCLSNLLIN